MSAYNNSVAIIAYVDDPKVTRVAVERIDHDEALRILNKSTVRKSYNLWVDCLGQHFYLAQLDENFEIIGR